MPALNKVELFLLHLEKSEKIVFEENLDYLVFYFISFDMLTSLINLEAVINFLDEIEFKTGGVFIRNGRDLSLAMNEKNVNINEMKRMLFMLMEIAIIN